MAKRTVDVIDLTGEEEPRPPKKRGPPRKTPEAFTTFKGATFSQSDDALKFEVAGKPLPKRRPVKSSAGKYYNPSKQDEKDFRDASEKEIKAHRPDASFPIFEKKTLLEVDLLFGFQKSRDDSDRVASLMSTGDADNIVKLVLDSMNKLVYDDDRQIIDIIARKRLLDRPKIVVNVRKIDVNNI